MPLEQPGVASGHTLISFIPGLAFVDFLMPLVKLAAVILKEYCCIFVLHEFEDRLRWSQANPTLEHYHCPVLGQRIRRLSSVKPRWRHEDHEDSSSGVLYSTRSQDEVNLLSRMVPRKMVTYLLRHFNECWPQKRSLCFLYLLDEVTWNVDVGGTVELPDGCSIWWGRIGFLWLPQRRRWGTGTTWIAAT